MAAEGNNNFIRYVYRGEEGEIIPREATHIFVGEDCTFVRARAFDHHPNIIEVICHDRVKKIGEYAFYGCPNLRRVIMPGVKIAEEGALWGCKALTDVECGKLEIIEELAFQWCTSLESINLLSARIVEENAFGHCEDLTDVKFGSKLEREGEALYDCCNLERITIPLKNGLITEDNIFTRCANLMHINPIEGELHETIAVLQLEEWRNDMNEEIDCINRILPNTPAGDGWNYDEESDGSVECDEGGKALVTRTWIRSVIRKINHYKAQHQHVLDEAVLTLQHALPHDILMNNVLPFLELPSYTFEGEDHIIYV